MNKKGFIKILIYGREKYKRRYWEDWIDTKNNVINKKERVSCCYALFFKGIRDHQGNMLSHLISPEHIEKLVERYGLNDEYLLREIRYYTSKILEGK